MKAVRFSRAVSGLVAILISGMFASIAAAGSSDMVMHVASASAKAQHQSSGLRSHDPALDEVIQIPDFEVVTFPNGGEPVVFTIPAGLETEGQVLGFSFEGVASGVTGTGTWVSNTCMVVEAPDGTIFGVGGTNDSVYDGCANQDAHWDFHGIGSNVDGDYESSHDDVFDPAPDSEGEWKFTFVHGWNAGAGVPIVWEDVTVTLHKTPLTDPRAEVSPGSFAFEVPLGGGDSDILSLTNTGVGELVWSIATDLDQPSDVRSHDPMLDEAFQIPDFEIVTFPNGGEPVVFSIPGGVDSRGEVVGFSFEGTASGVTGTITWISNTCLVIEAPDGTQFGVGGASNVFDGCGNQDAQWDFHGSVSNTDGDFESFHDDVFDPMLEDDGNWTFTFAHDFNSPNGSPISWEDVVITLHKAPLPACSDDLVSADWLIAAPPSGVTAEDGTDTISVIANSAGLDAGLYEAWLCLTTNDPTAALVPMPVEMKVFEENTGAISGTVTGEGYCSETPAALEGALVSVEGQNDTFTTTTLSDGSYSLEIDADESPLTVTVSAAGHLDSIATDVVVTTGSTTHLDFSSLVDSPCATTTPSAFEETLNLGQAGNFDLIIGNLDGASALDWDVHFAHNDCDEPAPIDWMSAAASSGSVAPGSDSTLGLDVDTADLSDGVYDALVCVATNDDQNAEISIPFELTVVDVELAVLEGTVTSQGLCGTDSNPLVNATVDVQGANDSFQTTTDENGFYQFEIFQSESPVDMVATAADHSEGIANGVVLVGNDTTTVNFDLTSDADGQSACIEVDPVSLSATVPVTGTIDQTMEIANFGPQTLDWEIELMPSGARSSNEAMLADGVLLVSQNQTGFAVALDPETGNVLDPQFMSFDGLNLLHQYILHPDGDRILAGSQNDNVVYSFSLDGELLGVFAPAGGEDPDILRNVRGLAIHPDTGNLLVTSGFWNSVEEFDMDGNYLGEFISPGAGGVGGPWSIAFRESDVLVSDSGGSIYRFEHDGSFISLFNSDIAFPQQIMEIDNGNVLAAAFGAPSGAWEMGPGGNQIAVYGPMSNLRGVYELPNGNLLVTNSGGIHEIDRNGELVETKITGNSYMISHVQTRDCTVPDWLSFEPVAGSLPSGAAPDTVTVTFNPDGMAPGVYEDSFCVTSNDPVRPVLEVPVEMTVDQPVETAAIEGTVRSLGYCNAESIPLADAQVTIDTGTESVVRTTNANGFYQAFLPETDSPVDIEVTTPNHFAGIAEGITFVGGDTVVEDFDMLLAAPCATVDPDRVTMSLDPEDDATSTVVLGNMEGNIVLGWSLQTAPRQAGPRDHFPETPRYGLNDQADEVFFGIDDSGRQMAVRGTEHTFPEGVEVPAYSTTGAPAMGYQFLDATQPGNLTTIIDPQPERVYAATFIDNDFSREYMLASAEGTLQVNTLGYIDTQSGEFTSLGLVTGAAPGVWTSMKWDHSTATLYASNFGSNGESVLYTIDLVTLEASAVGTIEGPTLSNSATVVAIAVSPEGLMYGIDISGNVLLAIDKTNAEASVIGNLGVNPTAAQDMDFDQSTGTLYWAGFFGNQDSRILTVNTETGGTTTLGAVDGSPQLMSFSIAIAGAGFDCENPEDVEWLTIAPPGGSTPPGSSTDLELSLSAAGLTPGEYGAGICISTNDPLYPLIKVPVELTVTVPDRYATVEGLVQGMGRCEQNPSPLTGAQVILETQQAIYELQTDDSGLYSIAIEPDEGPVDITVTADGHLGDGVTSVALSEFDVVTQDFNLTSELACTTVDQGSMEATLVTGSTEFQTLMLANSGLTDGFFTVVSRDEGSEVRVERFSPVRPAMDLRDDVGSRAGLLSERPEQQRSITVSTSGTMFDVLVVSPDSQTGSHPIPPVNLVDDLNAFPDMNAVLYTEPVADLTLADLEPFDAVITSNSGAWSSVNANVSVGDALADFVDMGGKVVLHNFAYDFLGFQLAGRFMTENYGPITQATGDVMVETEMVILESDSPIFENVNSVGHGNVPRLTGSTLTSGAQVLAEWDDGIPMLVANENVLAVNAMYSANGEPADWTGDLDIIVYNAVRNLVGIPIPAAEWLSFDPTEGTVASEGQQAVEVGFTALPDLPAGTYFADILVQVDDGAHTIEIPVEMEILDAPTVDRIFRDCFAEGSSDTCAGKDAGQ